MSPSAECLFPLEHAEGWREMLAQSLACFVFLLSRAEGCFDGEVCD